MRVINIDIEQLKPGTWKRLFLKRFRFHTYRFRFHKQKVRKRPLIIFFNFCESVACLLLHFVACRALLFIKLPCQTSFCPFFFTTAESKLTKKNKKKDKKMFGMVA